MIKAKKLPPLAWLEQQFELDHDGGRLIRKTSYGKYAAGSVAGTAHPDGYIQMGLMGERHLAHRVIFYMATGKDPEGFHVDHINGDRSDNRPSNLRLATQVENLRHRTRMVSTNKSGHRNVSWNNYWNRWQVALKVNGKCIQRSFHNIEDAVACAKKLREQHFGEFAGVVN